jgi:hypothetical protein
MDPATISAIIAAIVSLGKAIADVVATSGKTSEEIKAWCEGQLISLRTAGKASCLAEANNAIVDAERQALASPAPDVFGGALAIKIHELGVELRKAFSLPASVPTDPVK